ncbi:hypothetical protein [Pontibacter ruber]|uniref:Transmembrane protein n=1 Tax=Pontibacter ruber TaxID=1343895 RepID=A0ABW5CY32_9BACT
MLLLFSLPDLLSFGECKGPNCFPFLQLFFFLFLLFFSLPAGSYLAFFCEAAAKVRSFLLSKQANKKTFFLFSCSFALLSNPCRLCYQPCLCLLFRSLPSEGAAKVRNVFLPASYPGKIIFTFFPVAAAELRLLLSLPCRLSAKAPFPLPFFSVGSAKVGLVSGFARGAKRICLHFSQLTHLQDHYFTLCFLPSIHGVVPVQFRSAHLCFPLLSKLSAGSFLEVSVLIIHAAH